MEVKIGSKYMCSTCSSEFIITKAAPQTKLKCCGAELEKK